MRNGILGSMATLALGAGMAFGQSTPTLQQGLQIPVGGPAYGAAPAYPMPQTFAPADSGLQAAPLESAPLQPGPNDSVPPMPTQEGPTLPGHMQPESTVQEPPGQFEGPATSAPVGRAPGRFLPGRPLLAVPGENDGEDWLGDSKDHYYGPGPVPYRVFGSAEYLVWWVKPGVPTPPLATTGAAATGGILGSGAAVVLGSQELDYGQESGIRATAGFWIDKQGHAGIELTGLWLPNRSVSGAIFSDVNGNPLIARPIVNAQLNQEASFLLATPGQLAGGVDFTSSSQFYGAETNFVGSIYRSKCLTADTLFGFRYAHLQESLNIASNTTVLPGGIAAFNGNPVGPGGMLSLTDRFETRNEFYGGQLGARMQVRRSRFFAEVEGKVAFGNVHENMAINGATTLVGVDGSTATLPGGLLAVGSNSGFFSRDVFTFIPEGSAKVGVHITNCITAFVGYTFIYWFDAARPSEQVDRTVNPSLVPANLAFGSGTGPNRPIANFNHSDFWAQGVNFGVEVRY